MIFTLLELFFETACTVFAGATLLKKTVGEASYFQIWEDLKKQEAEKWWFFHRFSFVINIHI